MKQREQLELNLEMELQRPVSLVRTRSPLPNPAQIAPDNIISFEAAKIHYIKEQEQDLIRRVTSWNKHPKSS